jgi:hypothetical protein
VTGCATGAVDVTPPQPAKAVVALCERLAQRLPDTLVGLHSRDTAPPSPLTHAWGSPAVTLSCGVPKPAGYNPKAASVLAVDSVVWTWRSQGHAQVWTAILPRPGHQPDVYVALTIPRDYPAGDAFLVTLARPLKAANAEQRYLKPVPRRTASSMSRPTSSE